MSRTTRPIPVVTQYFDDLWAMPVIAQVFRPAVGWKRYPFRKRISRSWARKLRKEGVTHVALEYNGRRADFRIEELTR